MGVSVGAPRGDSKRVIKQKEHKVTLLCGGNSAVLAPKPIHIL